MTPSIDDVFELASALVLGSAATGLESVTGFSTGDPRNRLRGRPERAVVFI